MDFEFSDEQLALRDLSRDLFERESPASRLRGLWTSDEPRDDKVWRTMAEAGLLGVTVPEKFGGLAGTEVDLVLLLEEAGRACLPEPVVDTAIGASLLAEAGTDEQQRAWLPRIVGGDAMVAVQLAGSPFVVDADIADLLLLERESELHAVPGPGFVVRPVPSEDRARRLFEVDADTSPATRMAGGAAEGAEAGRRGAWATAAMLNGLAVRMLEMTLEHVRSREQFRRPVGSFQAVKHRLADAHVLIDAARAAAWYAANALATNDPDREIAVRVAKAAAADAESFMNNAALQLHGGIGFTWEHDLHFWLKRGNALRPAYGSARHHRAALSEHVFDA
ncbi:MAG: acyl-CoA dehydrogenase family protein [Actinomycetota bacterium]